MAKSLNFILVLLVCLWQSTHAFRRMSMSSGFQARQPRRLARQAICILKRPARRVSPWGKERGYTPRGIVTVYQENQRSSDVNDFLVDVYLSGLSDSLNTADNPDMHAVFISGEIDKKTCRMGASDEVDIQEIGVDMTPDKPDEFQLKELYLGDASLW